MQLRGKDLTILRQMKSSSIRVFDTQNKPTDQRPEAYNEPCVRGPRLISTHISVLSLDLTKLSKSQRVTSLESIDSPAL